MKSVTIREGHRGLVHFHSCGGPLPWPARRQQATHRTVERAFSRHRFFPQMRMRVDEAVGADRRQQEDFRAALATAKQSG